MLCVHGYVSGRVQGVFFRENTRKMAQDLGLKGWVRNLSDGRVEVVFEGDDEAVKKMIEFCRNGPGMASVLSFDFGYEAFKNFESFEIK